MPRLTTPAAYQLDEFGRPAGMSWEQYSDHMERVDRKARRELRRTAYHEAGHAVFAAVRRIPFDWVAVRPLTQDLDWLDRDQLMGPYDLGLFYEPVRPPTFDHGSVWFEQLLLTLAGPAAEAHLVGLRRVFVGGSDQEAVDFFLAESRQVDRERVLEDCMALARRFVAEREPEIFTVAEALSRHRYLESRQVKRLVGLVRPRRGSS